MSESSIIMPDGDNKQIYVPLHCHTEHSVLDGLSKPSELAKRARELGMPACAITDHGAMSGCVEFYQACLKEGIKPILGMEAYTTPYGHTLDERVPYDIKELRDVPGRGHQRNNYHLILLAKDYRGFTNLCTLHTASYAQGYYYKPRIDFELLKQHHEGLICSNACFTSGHQVRVKSTKGGIVTQNIEDVKAGQYVLTHDNTWQEVIEPTKRKYNGDGYRIVITNQLAHEREITCSANHEFFVYRRDTNSTDWVSADSLCKNDVLLEPLTYKRIYRSSRRNDAYVISASELNSLMNDLYTIIPEESFFTEDLHITPAMMMTFGLWLADGSITTQAHRVCFTFNNAEFQSFFDSFVLKGLKDINNDVEMITSLREELKRADLAIHDKKIFTVFSYLFGNVKSNDKHIPNKLKHISKKYDAALLYGYMLGDGCFHYECERDGGQITCVSVSSQLITDIYELWTWFEFSPSVEAVEPSIDKKGTYHQQSWYLKVNNTLLAALLDKEHIFDECTFEKILEAAQLWGNKKKTNIITVNGVKYRMKRVANIEKIHLNEEVYCLNVSTNHDFVCNGVIVHNCVLGEVNHHLLKEDFGMAREHALRLQELFGDDYYFEIMNHGLDMEIAIMPRIRELAKELGIKVIATNDNHFTYKEDAKLQRTMMLLGMHKSWSDADVVGSFFEDEILSANAQKLTEGADGDSDPIFAMPPSLYVKDYNEMMEVLCLTSEDEQYARQELANTLEIAEKCNCELPIIDPNDMSQYHTPLYAIEKDLQYDEYKNSGFELRQATIDKVVEAMNAAGKEGSTLDEVLTEHEHASLHFLMWMCEKGIEERIRPKIEARGEPLPIEFYMENPPEGFQVVHKHNSPDESYIKGKLAEGLTPGDIINEYLARLDYEVSVVCRKGFLDYFSIVQQYCNYARFNDSPPGPGRGSGAGALLNYLLGITSVDPLPNKLIFERFLNPDRVGYPDIDVDFDKAFRDGLGEYSEEEGGDGLGGGLKGYLRREYGADNAAGVSTFIYAWGKAALRAAARVLFNPPESVQWADDLCNLIDDHPKLDLNSELQEGVNPNFVAKVNSARHYKQILDLALMLQGRITGTSIHASAFILSPHSITDKMPLTVPKAERERVQKTGEKTVDYLIAFDGDVTQTALGYVKLDLLCIKDLEVLTLTMKTIERVYGCKIDIENIPMDDEAVFQMLYDHNVAGIFQLDGSAGMAQVMDDVKPQSIEEMNAVIALFRPGPMDYIPNYINGKWHPETVKYLDPRLEPILKDTYGVCCYQEEAMQITQAIAGFTGGQADNYRKQAAKKHMDQLVLIKDDFINGALANGTDSAVADELWEQLVKFGSYAFNRSHSAAYAYIAYRGGFLKAHFPEAFLAAMCSIKPMMKKVDKVPSYLEEARQMGVTVKSPHVNYSMDGFDVPEKGVIAFGLGGVKRVGQGAGPIIAEREANGPYKDFTDFCTRVPKQVGKAPIEALIKAGALDGLGWSRMAMEESIDQIIDFRKRWFAEQEKKSLFADDLFGFGDEEEDAGIELVAPFDTEYSERELMNKEKEQFGMYFNKDPRDFCRVSRYITETRLAEQSRTAFKAGAYDHPRFVNVSEITSLPDKTLVQFIGNIRETRAFRTKKGDMMASVFIWDNGVAESSRFGFAPTKSEIKCTIFPKTWASTTPPLVDDVVVVTGRVSVDANGEWPTAVLVDKIETLAPDSDWISSSASLDRAKEYQEAYAAMIERDNELADPSSKRYLIPAIEFKNTTDLDAFLLDPDLDKYRGEGRVQVSVRDDETGNRTEVISLRQTRGMVAFAARYGGVAAKIRLPKAQRALERQKMMTGLSSEED